MRKKIAKIVTKIVEFVHRRCQIYLGIDNDALTSIQTDNFDIMQYAKRYSLAPYEDVLFANSVGLGPIVEISAGRMPGLTDWQDRVTDIRSMKDIQIELSLKFNDDLRKHIGALCENSVEYDVAGSPRNIVMKLLTVKEKK